MKKFLPHQLRYKLFLLIVLSYSTLLFNHAIALTPEQRIPKQEYEDRAQAIFKVVRCIICQGQMISDSDTEFSFMIKNLIRSNIASGMSDDEILKDLSDNFGNKILISSELASDINYTHQAILTLPIALSLLLIIYYIFKSDIFRKTED